MKSIKKKLKVYTVKITFYDRRTKETSDWSTEMFDKPTKSRVSTLLNVAHPLCTLCDFEFSEAKKTFEIPMKTFIMHAMEVKND